MSESGEGFNPRESTIAPKETFTPEQELKMSVLASGVRPTDNARIALGQTSEGKIKTTGDYGTTRGIIFRTGKYTTVNAAFPDNNPHAQQSPNVLDFHDGQFWVTSGNNQPVPVEHIPPPEYTEEKDPSGIPYKKLISTHTDRARISPIQGCSLNCQFCNVPAEARYEKMDQKALVDSVKVALEDRVRPAQHLLISGGTPGPRDYGYLNDVYEAVATTYPGLDVDIMMTPSYARDGRELLDPKRLKELGINGLSVNLELHSPQAAEQYMAGKYKIGQERYLQFLEKAVEAFGVSKVRSMLLVGLEPAEETLQAVEKLAQRGVCPELSPYIPSRYEAENPLKDIAPPSVEEQKRVWLGTQEILDKYRSKYPDINDGLQCIDCMHNVLMFPGKQSYIPHYDPEAKKTTYEFPLANS